MMPQPAQPDASTTTAPGDAQARRLANLRPAWPQGTSGNPAGRPRAGASIREQVNALQDATTDELKAIVDDPSQPAHRRTAARIWTLASDATSHARHSLDALKVICDYTEGKPHQAVTVSASHESRPLAERARAVLDALRRGQVPDAADVPRIAYIGGAESDPLESRG